MTGKQILLAAAAIIACTNNACAQNTWYGLLTVDEFPFKNCDVTGFKSYRVTSWFNGATPEQTQDLLNNLEVKYQEDAERNGFNAVLGYRTNFIGNGTVAYGGKTVAYGLITLNGVAVTVKCK